MERRVIARIWLDAVVKYTMTSQQRALNIPSGVLVAIFLMAGTHLLRISLPDDQGVAMLLGMAFIPARYAGAVTDIPGGDISALTSFITYMFVHGDWTHLLFNIMWMLAFGSAVAKRAGSVQFLIFSALCGVAGVLTHLALHFGELVPVVGASAAISGQMAGALRFMFGAQNADLASSRDIARVPLATIVSTLTNLKFLGFLGVWVLLNVLFGLGGVQLDNSGASIAWEAHIGGFVCGLLVFGAFDRAAKPDKEMFE